MSSSSRRFKITQGSVWTIEDDHIQMPPTARRTVTHDTRPVIVISNDKKNLDDNFPIVLVCPVSTSNFQNFVTQYDLAIAKNNGNLERDSWARTTLVQPLEKELLTDLKGTLPEEILLDLLVGVSDYLGLLDDIPESEDEIPAAPILNNPVPKPGEHIKSKSSLSSNDFSGPF